MHRFFFTMRIYTVDLTSKFQIIAMAADAQVLGILPSNYPFSSTNTPKLLLQDDSRTAVNRQGSEPTTVPIFRSVHVHELPHTDIRSEDCSQNNFERILSQEGRLTTSTFSLISVFQFLEHDKRTTLWAAYIERLPNEHTSVVSDMPLSASSTLSNYAEGALIRTLN